MRPIEEMTPDEIKVMMACSFISELVNIEPGDEAFDNVLFDMIRILITTFAHAFHFENEESMDFLLEIKQKFTQHSERINALMQNNPEFAEWKRYKNWLEKG